MKANIDAAFHALSSFGASGCVVRDNNGEIMAVKARWHEHVPDVLTYGSTGSKGWLLLALALDYRRMTLEVDNISLVNLLKSPNGCRSPIAGS
jgi:hypothetical protein